MKGRAPRTVARFARGRLNIASEFCRYAAMSDSFSTAGSPDFDAVAGVYDADFTDTPLGRRKREIVHRYLAGELRPGWRVLELNCGTGQDAVWLSGRVRHVTATDISGEMVRTAAEKCRAAGRTNVSLLRMDIRELATMGGMNSGEGDGEAGSGRFDLVFSDFDGLNCVRDLSFFPEALRSVLAPGGEAILVLMSRYCAAEILGFGVRGMFGRAFARLRRGGRPVNIGKGASAVTWFHPVASLLRLFRKGGFRIVAVRGVGLTTPPTSMRSFYHRRISLFRKLEPLEDALSPRFPFNRMGDHVLIHIRKRE